jgi:hypothetical protein
MDEALREVDALTPGSPPLHRPTPEPVNAIGPIVTYTPWLLIPRGWRYEAQADVYVDPHGGRIEGEYIRAMANPQLWFINQAKTP